MFRNNFLLLILFDCSRFQPSEKLTQNAPALIVSNLKISILFITKQMAVVGTTEVLHSMLIKEL